MHIKRSHNYMYIIFVCLLLRKRASVQSAFVDQGICTPIVNHVVRSLNKNIIIIIMPKKAY